MTKMIKLKNRQNQQKLKNGLKLKNGQKIA